MFYVSVKKNTYTHTHRYIFFMHQLKKYIHTYTHTDSTGRCWWVGGRAFRVNIKKIIFFLEAFVKNQ